MKWLSDVAKLWPGARPSQGPQGWTRPHPFRRFAPTAARLSGAPSAPADWQEREVALRLLPIGLHGGELIVTDKGYSGRDFKATIAERFGALLLRPTRKDEPDKGPHLAPIRQSIESIFWTLKDRLGLERHNARTLHGLRARITTKLLALAAGGWLNHQLGRPTRAFANLAT
jgi:hypothetical protein